jgi:hypothetical protein
MVEMSHITTPEYPSSGDLCRIFSEETDSLYRLSLMLTADHEKAEQCFVYGLEESVEVNAVFKEWARSWARRVIIQNAVRIINPRSKGESAGSSFTSGGMLLTAERPEMVAVLALEPFERFVYVMSVLERYSDQDCSILLVCASRDVIATRIRALQQTGSAMELHLADAERF